MTPESEILDPARCAEIAAHLAHFPLPNHAEIVARFGLRWRDWEAASARCTAARDEELAAGAVHLSSRFVRAFVTTAERLQAQQTSLESIGPLPHTFRLEAAPVAEPAPLVHAVAGELLVIEVYLTSASAEDIGAPSLGAQGTAPVAPPASRRFEATVGVSDVPAMRMPFVSAPATTNPAGDQALDRAIAHAAAIQGPRAPTPAAGATVAVSGSAAMPPLPAGAPDLTMAQYTSLRVELNLFPDRAARIRERYGVRPEAQEALFAHWRSRFEVDPPLRMWFAQSYARYLAWLRENPGALESAAMPPARAE